MDPISPMSWRSAEYPVSAFGLPIERRRRFSVGSFCGIASRFAGRDRGCLASKCEPRRSAAKAAVGGPKETGKRGTAMTELARELKYTKEQLQTAVEEMETSQEELKSANEELQSTNEELQSTNARTSPRSSWTIHCGLCATPPKRRRSSISYPATPAVRSAILPPISSTTACWKI